MSIADYLKKNIVHELVKQGASPVVAQQAADFAAAEYRRRSTLGKDAFGELLRIAGNTAMNHDPQFKYVQPRPKVNKRFTG